MTRKPTGATARCPTTTARSGSSAGSACSGSAAGTRRTWTRTGRRTRRPELVVALAGVLLLACASAAQAGGKPPPAAKKGGTVKIELQIASDHFLPGEQVPVTVQIVNAGPS